MRTGGRATQATWWWPPLQWGCCSAARPRRAACSTMQLLVSSTASTSLKWPCSSFHRQSTHPHVSWHHNGNAAMLFHSSSSLLIWLYEPMNPLSVPNDTCLQHDRSLSQQASSCSIRAMRLSMSHHHMYVLQYMICCAGSSGTHHGSCGCSHSTIADRFQG